MFRSIYEQLAAYKPLSFSFPRLNVENFIQVLKNGGEFTSLTEKEPSPEEKYLIGAREIRKLHLEEGVVVEPRRYYVSGYQDLSYEEFVSYIYWRTQIRNRQDIEVPGGFLALYLIEIVNFVEVNSVDEALQTMEYLEELSSNESKNLKQINNARREMIFLYGTKEFAEKLVAGQEYEYLLEDERICRRCQDDLFTLLCKRHYSACLKSKMFLERKQELETAFYSFFYYLMDYFVSQGVDLLALYNGKALFLPMRNVYIRNVEQEKIIHKDIDYKGYCIIKVRTNTEILTKHYTNGTPENMAYQYVRQVVMKYILRVFEQRMRAKLGYPKIYPSIEDLQKGFYKEKICRHIVNILDSDEKDDLIWGRHPL